MELEDFLAKLHADNPSYREVSRFFTYVRERDHLVFIRRGRDLAEVVTNLCAQRIYPVVDKRLQMVIGSPFGAHEVLRAVLYAYHERLTGITWGDQWRTQWAAAEYIKRGYGYYISRMETDLIIMGENYRPDRSDRELFAIFPTAETL